MKSENNRQAWWLSEKQGKREKGREGVSGEADSAYKSSKQTI